MNISFSFAWWWLPIGCIVLGFIGAAVFGRSRGDYDFSAAFMGIGSLALGFTAAIAICIGRWVS